MTRIFVVDDNPGDLDLVVIAMGMLREDLPVIPCLSTGDPVAAIVAEAKPDDVILLDINMPLVDGFAALAGLRRARPEITRIVVLSGSPNPRDRERALALGAVMMVRKPDRFGEWSTILSGILSSCGVPDGPTPSG
jgi:CheY-like chemotaxis protein